MVRPRAISHGYYKNHEATAETWRNGWFHTGDAFRMTKDGDFFYVDRIMDEFPKTPTTKIQKGPLREAGITPNTWDREEAGIKNPGGKAPLILLEFLPKRSVAIQIAAELMVPRPSRTIFPS